MAKQPLNSCCCCIDLRKGGVIMGILLVLGSFRFMYDAFIAMYWVDVVCVLWLPVGILMIIGSLENKPNLLLPYMIFTPIAIILTFIKAYATLEALDTIARITGEPFDRSATATVLFSSSAIGSVIAMYFWVCVYSLFLSMKELTKPRRNSHA